MKYRSEIDGLRALAVMPVMFFHAGFAPFAGGFVGVDIFFVISGYLITTILINDLEGDRFSIIRFYERRARRILPALFFVMAVSLPVAFAVMTPPQLEDFGQSLVAVALFVSNIFFYFSEDGYFAPQTELYPMLHTWSLAVEEQFYIVFPILLLLLWRFGRMSAFWVLGGIGLASLILADQGWRWPQANFYLALSRAWELLAGAFCAFVLTRRAPMANNALSLAGLVLVLGTIFLLDKTYPFPGRYAVPTVLGTMLIILFATPQTWVGRVLSLKPILFLGLISYSAYLWHQPVLAFARIHWIVELPLWLKYAAILASLGLAWFSWHFVEQPFRKAKGGLLPGRRGLFVASGVGLAATIVLGVGLSLGKGLPGRYPAPDFIAAGQFALPQIDNGYCFYSLARIPALEVGQDGVSCPLGDTDAPTRALLFGDSFAGHWEPFWHEVGAAHGLAVNAITTNWCYPSAGDNFPGPQGNPAYQQCILNRDHVRDVAGDYDIVILGADWRAVEQRNYGPDALAYIETLLAETQAQILIMPAPPAFYRLSVEQAAHFGAGPLIDHPERNHLIEALHAPLQTLAAAEPRVRFLNREMLFGDYHGSGGAHTADGQPYSLEGQHISIYGALSAARHVLATRGLDGVLAPQVADSDVAAEES